MMKKIWAAVLALMILAMSVSAFASDTTLDANGEQGVFQAVDTPVAQDKVLVLEKELKVYNLNESEVNAPTITYEYKIAKGSAGKSVTDNADKHAANQSVTAPTKEGIVAGVTITGTAANEISFTTADKMAANTDGASNKKYLSISFKNVVFEGAGIYRYEITESLKDGFSYDNTGVTETTGTHVRYVDVYVKPAETFNNGSNAAEWDIYGFTCFYNDEDITDSDKTKNAVKTTGFVDGTSNGSTKVLADQYYTYNLTISKTVVGDNYAKLNHDFPFTVIFTNSDITKNILLKATAGTGVSNYTFLTTAGAPTYNGVMLIKDVDNNNSIKLIGIPMGTDVEVYETNDVAGTTYQVTTIKDGVEPGTVDAMVISGTKPTSAVAQAATKANDQSTKSVIDTTKNADDDNAHTIDITNTLVTISPTGVVLRIAPYIMILAAGIILLLVSRRRKAVQD
ncbi:MAG: hypothetical protein IJ210_08855 [Clostridia bacterium]|nr:hypothetical protein [Clostridia bacterium]